jgi:hypothetical protein
MIFLKSSQEEKIYIWKRIRRLTLTVSRLIYFVIFRDNLAFQKAQPPLFVRGDRLYTSPRPILNFHLPNCLYIALFAVFILLSLHYYNIYFTFPVAVPSNFTELVYPAYCIMPSAITSTQTKNEAISFTY